MLFYLTDEGVAGRAVKQDGQWSWQPYEGDGQTQQVASLFDSFKKRIRVVVDELMKKIRNKIALKLALSEAGIEKELNLLESGSELHASLCSFFELH